MKALALVSGGLDSLLAAKLMQKQGIEVVGLNFQIPFCAPKKQFMSGFGIELHYIDIRQDFLAILKHPRYGFGSQMNPCIDCKIFMLQRTKELMPQYGAQFVITGEVVGQRPMSQNRQMLDVIEKKSGLQELLLRPLSARLLPETIPEKKGWVNRHELLYFNGRGRGRQIELAVKLGIAGYAQPAGGCLLTDPQFSVRLKELIGHNELDLDNIELLKVGRHFRLSPKTKLIVGRNQRENDAIFTLAKQGDYIFAPPEEVAGPTALGRGVFDEALINLSCEITLAYCNLRKTPGSHVLYKKVMDNENKIAQVSAIDGNKLAGLRVG